MGVTTMATSARAQASVLHFWYSGYRNGDGQCVLMSAVPAVWCAIGMAIADDSHATIVRE